MSFWTCMLFIPSTRSCTAVDEQFVTSPLSFGDVPGEKNTPMLA